MDFEKILENLEDNKEYAIMRVGANQYEGSLTIQNAYGDTIKKNQNTLDENDDIAFLFPMEYSKATTRYKLKDMVEHNLFSDMKDKEFQIYGKDKENKEYNEELPGRELCDRLDDLLDNNVSMTIIEKNTRAYRNEVEWIPKEENTVYISELDELTKANFCIDNTYKTSPLASKENVYEHHKD